MSTSTTYIPTAAEAGITALVAPLQRNIAQFTREIKELDRQYTRLLNNPHRLSTHRDEQFVYKRALVTWYHEGLPRAMKDLEYRLATFWTAAPVGMAWMEVYERQRKQHRGKTIGVVKTVMDLYPVEIVRMEETIINMFRDMGEMMMLNPGWKGAEKWPLFVAQGSVITVDPTGEKALMWLALLEG